MWVSVLGMALFAVTLILFFATGNWWFFALTCGFQIVAVLNAGFVGNDGLAFREQKG